MQTVIDFLQMPTEKANSEPWNASTCTSPRRRAFLPAPHPETGDGSARSAARGCQGPFFAAIDWERLVQARAAAAAPKSDAAFRQLSEARTRPRVLADAQGSRAQRHAISYQARSLRGLRCGERVSTGRLRT